ncbi:MAG: MlaD family protein [Sulfuricurvum sp.]
MESKVNYTLVGVFVLTLSAALIAFAFWLAKYSQDGQNYHQFKVYMTESVSGLTPEATVKFHGVDVGIVESIGINPKNSEEVELTLKIKKETPIKVDSSAVLKFYGVTGLAFIEIIGGTKNAPLLSTSPQSIATIKSSLSDESLSNIASKLSATLDRADRLFSNQNIENVAQTLEHLRSLTQQIDDYQSEIKILLQRSIAFENNATDSFVAMNNAADNVKNTSANFNTLVETKMTTTLESLETTSRESHALIRKIEASVDRGDYDLRSISSPAIAEMGELLEQTRTLTNEMETTLRALRESPSDVLFKQSKPNPGPGE